LAMALSLSKIGRGAKVLLPAYNCRSMVDAVHSTGAMPVLYKSRPDLAVDLDDLSKKIDAETRCLIVVHFFGFFQPQLAQLRVLCDELGIVLIEDCAHCFFGEHEGQQIGSVGDYAIASPTKFFPVYDGGLLVSAKHSLDDVPIRRGGAAFQIKAFLNNIERSFAYSRLRPLNWLMALPLYAKDRLWSLAKNLDTPYATDTYGTDASGDSFAFDAAWLGVKMSAVSNALLHWTRIPRLVERRRQHFETLLRAFAGHEGCRPLFDELPPGVVPYVFPLIVDDAVRVFPKLKVRGVPLFRWEDVRHGVCDTSTLYSRCLFQLPCHQELTQRELEWLIAEVKRALEP
jgi:perosamine synthetase